MSKLMVLNLASEDGGCGGASYDRDEEPKKRMIKRGSCRSPEASSTEHLFPAMSFFQCNVDGGRGCM